MYSKLNFELMDNKTQFWQNPVNSLIFFKFYIYQRQLDYTYCHLFKIYIFFKLMFCLMTPICNFSNNHEAYANKNNT